MPAAGIAFYSGSIDKQQKSYPNSIVGKKS